MPDENVRGEIVKDLQWLHSDMDEVKNNYKELVDDVKYNHKDVTTMIGNLDEKIDQYMGIKCVSVQKELHEKINLLNVKAIKVESSTKYQWFIIALMTSSLIGMCFGIIKSGILELIK